MNSAETIERVPIHTDADGVVRVGGTRVTLDTILRRPTKETLVHRVTWPRKIMLVINFRVAVILGVT